MRASSLSRATLPGPLRAARRAGGAALSAAARRRSPVAAMFRPWNRQRAPSGTLSRVTGPRPADPDGESPTSPALSPAPRPLVVRRVPAAPRLGRAPHEVELGDEALAREADLHVHLRQRRSAGGSS